MTTEIWVVISHCKGKLFPCTTTVSTVDQVLPRSLSVNCDGCLQLALDLFDFFSDVTVFKLIN